VKAAEVVFDHLDRLTDERGLFEHALNANPRLEHGYCLDDVARGLVVVCREAKPTKDVQRLADCYLEFVLAAIARDGRCHNRMAVDGGWRDEPALGDWWGRALWGLGVASISAETAGLRARALSGFRIAGRQRSPHRRAMAFAALGAGEVLRGAPQDRAARDLLADAVRAIGPVGPDPAWPWPEPRLTYANAVLAEALIVAGDGLHDEAARDQGLRMLAFLMKVELHDGHLSVTPVGGRGQEAAAPGFDQQPIEAAALADACTSAYRSTTDPCWLMGVRSAWNWFLGENDSGTRMFDPATGAGQDGLEVDGCNLNQGAESTLAMLSTAQHARHLSALR
jgi:hypothetical protein